ncbi:hypothetical protein HXX76_013603 [Chlamydomonas incerta]|uniref:Uncharacterized protein n=1 Tax=Chlamydomonas incerta TaxID=51695 RepID=A0A835SEL8_CHLIN|nr:hypothetical protein HXX76_013603 [Chlamydomonas incerta]|eukprot:KAG2425559.1 hypothetical protein HXX76_013603 [Chlamydomonas incerta]
MLSLLAALALTASANSPRDSFEPLLNVTSLQDRLTQPKLIAELGSGIDGIRLLLTRASSLGPGLENWRQAPANLSTAPGLQFLASAVQAYIAFFPAVGLVTPGYFYFWPADTNTWWHQASSFKPGSTFSSFNGGTFYSSLWYSTAEGPVAITTPAFTAQNFWTINFYDIYTNAFRTVGSPYGNNAASTYWIVPPGWNDTAPEGTHVVYSPTVEGYLLGRTFAFPNTTAAAEFNVGWGAQAPFTLPRAIKFAYPEAAAAASDVDTADPLQFWRIAGEVYRRNGAPYVSDPLERLLPSLGLWQEYGFVQASVSPLALDALKAAAYYAHRILVAKWTEVGGADKNYWNAPWNWGHYGSDIVTAATVHKFFPIVNRAVDSLYYFIFVDSDGEVLDGAAEYDISFPAAPPIAANSFWSLTTGAVGVTAGPLAGTPPPGVVNPGVGALPVWSNIAADAYAIANGSWPFRVRGSVPAANSTASGRGWNAVVSPPSGAYYITLRLYVPLAEASSDAYVPPAVVRRRAAVAPAVTPSPSPSPSSPSLAAGGPARHRRQL